MVQHSRTLNTDVCSSSLPGNSARCQTSGNSVILLFQSPSKCEQLQLTSHQLQRLIELLHYPHAHDMALIHSLHTMNMKTGSTEKSLNEYNE